MALVDNKAKIQALLDGINALPDRDEGGTAEPVLQAKNVTPTKEAQSITPDTGYDGLSQVDVGAIPDEYIVPSGTVSITENGTHDVREAESVNVDVPAPEIKTQTKTVTPSETAQTVQPDSGYDGLSSVSVGAISSTYVGSGVTRQAAQTITPGTADKTIAAGRYLTGTQTINGDANLLPANIKSGVSIFGVAGTLEEGSGGGSGVAVETTTLHVAVTGDTKNVQGGIMYTMVYNDALFLMDAPFSGSSDGNLEIDKDISPVYGTLTMISMHHPTAEISISSVEAEGCDIMAQYDNALSVDVWDSEATIMIEVAKV